MKDEFNLANLKEDYKKLQAKHNLPVFEKLNEDFQIEKIAESETDFILREVRTCITDKFFNYLRFIESLITSTNAPMFVFAIAKTLEQKDREKLMELYKKIAKVDVDIIGMDLQYSEENEAKAIKIYYEMWQEIRKDLVGIVNVIKKNWDTKIEDSGKGYLG